MFFPLKPGEYSVKAHYRLARRVLLAVSGPHNEDRKARALSYVGHVTRRAEAASICWQGLGGRLVVVDDSACLWLPLGMLVAPVFSNS